jgi:hypothetical protein
LHSAQRLRDQSLEALIAQRLRLTHTYPEVPLVSDDRLAEQSESELPGGIPLRTGADAGSGARVTVAPWGRKTHRKGPEKPGLVVSGISAMPAINLPFG